MPAFDDDEYVLLLLLECEVATKWNIAINDEPHKNNNMVTAWLKWSISSGIPICGYVYV